MNWSDHIIIDPKSLVGKPIIKGTRISVEFVIDLLGRGWTMEQVLHELDHLKPDDLQACLAYASDVLRSMQGTTTEVDPIVAEIRKIRHAHAAQFNNDIAAICEDYRRMERESGGPYLRARQQRVDPDGDKTAECKKGDSKKLAG